jgi:hypothetical protein
MMMRILVFLTIALMIRQAEPGEPVSNKCQTTWIGWSREPYEYLIVDGKKVKAPKSDTVQYHLIEVRGDAACEAKLMALPAFIDERKKDTSYSASDGGFLDGKGAITFYGDTVSIHGKYTKAYYRRILGDSSFSYTLDPKGNKYKERKSGIVFYRISESERKKLNGKWGMMQ